MKKINKYLVIYRHLIVLLYLLIVLITFKFICNFKFTNGLSIVFIGLIGIGPIIVYIWCLVVKKQVKKKRNLRLSGFYKRIETDITTGLFTEKFLNPLQEIIDNWHLSKSENEITVSNNNVQILFQENHALISIVRTKVIYRYYYSPAVGDFTKFDKRGFQFKETSFLYISIVNLIRKLALDTLIYQENKKGYTLEYATSHELLYEYKVKQKLKKNTSQLVNILS